MPKKILCIGEVLWDVFEDSRKAGGAPMNVAMHLARFGHEVRMLSRIGQDQLGQEIKEFMEQGGLDTSFLQVDETLETSRVLVSLDAEQNASYEIPEPVAWDHLATNGNLERLSRDSDVIVYGSLASRNATARTTILQALDSPALKLMDVNLRSVYTPRAVVEELLPKADIVKLNDEELLGIAGWHGLKADSLEAAMEWFIDHYDSDALVVTRGARGAILLDPTGFYSHPGYRVKVADTVGAGDAFLAGFISALLELRMPGDMLSFACGTGALVASRTGGTPQYEAGEVEQIIQKGS